MTQNADDRNLTGTGVEVAGQHNDLPEARNMRSSSDDPPATLSQPAARLRVGNDHIVYGHSTSTRTRPLSCISFYVCGNVGLLRAA